MARFYILGSGGYVPTLQRQTCCYLLETRRGLILFDCGTGIARLHDPLLKDVVSRHKRVLVLLSHWHHDHIEGLHTLPFFFEKLEVTLGVPSASLTGFSAEEVLQRFGGKPLLPTPFDQWGLRFAGGFSVQELKPGLNKIAGERVAVIAQPHTDPSIGFRVRDVCYITDTTERPETAAFAHKAALLVHDAWLDRDGAAEHPAEARVHGTAEGAARIAALAGVNELVLAHLNPAYDPGRLERLILQAATVFPRTHLGADLMILKTVDVEEEAAVATAAPSAAEEDPATS